MCFVPRFVFMDLTCRECIFEHRVHDLAHLFLDRSHEFVDGARVFCSTKSEFL